MSAECRAVANGEFAVSEVEVTQRIVGAALKRAKLGLGRADVGRQQRRVNAKSTVVSVQDDDTINGFFELLGNCCVVG